MAFDPEKITFFAKTDARGQQMPFGIKAKDRTKHVYVIGKTGMGKSTMLENMAVQDIQNGEGLAFIDPHGQTAETLLEYIPEDRVKDVLYFAPFDLECPVAFNIMEDVGPDKRHLVVSGLMSVFAKIWVDAWSGRMEYILQNTLLALLEYPDSTLLGVNRMLSDKDYRKLVVDNITDPGVKSFWVDEFAKYNERYMQEAGDSIKNKIGQFTANPVIRNIIGQSKSSFDIRKMMDEKKILIMNLSKGLVGETNANLLGSMLTTRIYLAAMSRADLSPKQMEQMPNFYFYVDEFQSFANATFSNILSEARKYKLNLTIAHQYIEQMEEDVRNAVFGNVGTIISFRVGPFDAEELEKIFNPQFYATDICNLGFTQIYLTLMIDGIGSQPFSALTLPPIEPPNISCRDMVVAESRRQFSAPRAEVEAAVIRFHEPIEKPQQRTRSNQGERSQKEGSRHSGARSFNSRGDFTDKRSPVTNNSQRPSARTTEQTSRSSPDELHSERKSHSALAQKEVLSERALLSKNRSEQHRHATHEASSTPSGSQGSSRSHKKTKERNAVTSLRSTHSPAVHATNNNLEDLRSVLKKLSSTTTQAEKKKDKTSQLENKKTPISDDTHVSVKAKVTPEQGSSSVPHVSRAKKGRVSPKELERMMRVTTSDRPPIRS